MDDKEYVYKLVDPRDWLPFYVGITNDLDGRLAGHIHEAKIGRNGEKNEKIQEILAEGLSPLIEPIETLENKKRAGLREKYWILEYLAQGYPLTNIRLTNRKSITTSQGMFSIDLEEAIELEEANEKRGDSYYPEDYAGNHHYLNEEWEACLKWNKKYRAGEDVKVLLCCFYLAHLGSSPSDRVCHLIDLWYNNKLQEV